MLFVVLFVVWRVWQALASVGTCLMEMGWPPAPSHLANPGITSPGPPVPAPQTWCQPLPSASCHRPQLPALVTGELVSMVTVWGASGHLEPKGAEEGRVSMPSQPFSGTQRDLSCRAWQVLQQMRSGWALSFGDFFSYLLPDFVRSQLPQLCASEVLSLNPLSPAKGSGISSWLPPCTSWWRDLE